MQSRFIGHDMLMQFYLGNAVKNTYTHSIPPIGTTRVILECEGVGIVLAPSDCGNGERSSSGSEWDSETTSINSDAMDMDEDEYKGEGDKDADMNDE